MEHLVGEVQHPRPRGPGAAEPGCRRLTGPSQPRTCGVERLPLRPARRLDLPAINQDVGRDHHRDVDHRRQAVGEQERDQAQPDVEPVDPQRRPTGLAPGSLVDRDPVVLEHEVRDEVGQDEPGQDQDRVGHAVLPGGRVAATAIIADGRGGAGHAVAEDGGQGGDQPGQVAGSGPVRDDRDGCPADPKALSRLRPTQALDQQQARDLALPDGELGQQRRKQRREIREQRVRPRVTGDGCHPLTPRLGALEELARGAEGGAVALRRRPGAPVDVAGHDGPAELPRVRVQRRSNHAAKRVRVRSEQQLDLVALGEPGRRDSLGPEGGVQVVAERPQERGCTGVTARVHDVAKEHDGRYLGCHTREPTADAVSRKGLNDASVAESGKSAGCQSADMRAGVAASSRSTASASAARWASVAKSSNGSAGSACSVSAPSRRT